MLAYKFLSFSYMYGYGVRKNHKLSHDYAVKAIQLGDIGALGCLAQLYRMGWYVEKNIEKAKESAEQLKKKITPPQQYADPTITEKGLYPIIRTER